MKVPTKSLLRIGCRRLPRTLSTDMRSLTVCYSDQQTAVSELKFGRMIDYSIATCRVMVYDSPLSRQACGN